MPDDEQLKRFEEAVERKKEQAKAASERGDDHPTGSPVEGDQSGITEHGRPQDVQSPREKSSRKGDVTADKWNQ